MSKRRAPRGFGWSRAGEPVPVGLHGSAVASGRKLIRLAYPRPGRAALVLSKARDVRIRRFIVIALPLVVLIYGAVMFVTITILDPIAAVPTKSYPQIVAALGAGGTNMVAERAAVLTFAALGVGLSATVAIVGAVGARRTSTVVAWQLAVLAAGGLASFSLGIDVADTFGVGGGAHTPCSGILYGMSAAALGGMVAIVASRSRPATAATTTAR